MRTGRLSASFLPMKPPRVIVISIDGFASFYWRDPAVRAPVLRRPAERGVLAAGMECVFPSTTWPTHVSLVTGVSPRAHGVVANHILNRETLQPEDLTGDPIPTAPLRAQTATTARMRGPQNAAIACPPLATRRRSTSSAVLKISRYRDTDRRGVLKSYRARLPMHRRANGPSPKRFSRRMVGSVAATWRGGTSPACSITPLRR